MTSPRHCSLTGASPAAPASSACLDQSSQGFSIHRWPRQTGRTARESRCHWFRNARGSALRSDWQWSDSRTALCERVVAILHAEHIAGACVYRHLRPRQRISKQGLAWGQRPAKGSGGADQAMGRLPATVASGGGGALGCDSPGKAVARVRRNLGGAVAPPHWLIQDYPQLRGKLVSEFIPTISCPSMPIAVPIETNLTSM